MYKLQILLIVLSVLVIFIGAIALNTDIAYARPAACDCVCDCNLPQDMLKNLYCQAGRMYAYPCGREDPGESCDIWCKVIW